MIQETLRVTLPRAIDYGNLQIGSRAYSLNLFTFGANMFTRVDIGTIIYTPTISPVQIWKYIGNIERGQIGGVDGRIEIDEQMTLDDPLKLVIYNLSVDAELNLSIPMIGYMFNEFSG